MDQPKYLIIPNKHVVDYAQTISNYIGHIGLVCEIDTRFELKLEQRLLNTETYIVIAIGKRNRDAQTLQVRLENQIQEMSLENFVKFTIMLTKST
jgi:hypothetical protein